jgi:hypothetical protein
LASDWRTVLAVLKPLNKVCDTVRPMVQVRSVAVCTVLSGNSTRTACRPPVSMAMICGR